MATVADAIRDLPSGNRHLLKTIDEIRAFPGVGTVESGTFLEVVKQEYRISGTDGG